MLKMDLEDMDESGDVGDWCFLNNYELIAIRFKKDPFSGTVIIPIKENAIKGKEPWDWNGDIERPTLCPSLLINSGNNDIWHGFLTDGQLKEC